MTPADGTVALQKGSVLHSPESCDPAEKVYIYPEEIN